MQERLLAQERYSIKTSIISLNPPYDAQCERRNNGNPKIFQEFFGYNN